MHKLTAPAKPPPRSLRLFILLTLAIFLNACGVVEQDVTVYEDEAWKAEMRVGFTREELSMMGESEVVQQLNRQQSMAEAQGVDYEWNRKNGDDNRIYFIVKSSGSGYDLLNQIVFDEDATIETDSRNGLEIVQFSYTSSYDLARYALVLNTGEVLETNGIQSGKGQISWEGPGIAMYAIFAPKSSSNWLLYIGLAVGVIALCGVLFLLIQAWKRQRNRPAPTFSPSFCHRCGGQLDSAGTFCPHCGAQRL